MNWIKSEFNELRDNPLVVLFWVPIIFIVVIIVVGVPLGIKREKEIFERDTAKCAARGLGITSLIQGSGKNQTSKHICVGPDGQLFAI